MSLPVVHHPGYVTPLPPRYRFPMDKFGMVYQLLKQNGYSEHLRFFQPEIAPDEWCGYVHTESYLRQLNEGILEPRALRRIALPWTPELIRRTKIAVGGSVLTARLAFEHGLACNTAGGTHHAFPGYGAGYCLLNDLAITARVLQRINEIFRVLIIDLDVHQGDGTAAIFQQDPTVFTFSMHCQENFPYRKQHSDLDVTLPAGTRDKQYLLHLQTHLPDLLDKVQPDLVLYDAGVDPHEADHLGKLSLTDDGLRRRDTYVLEECLSHGYPVACYIGGGYDELQSLARRHCILHQCAVNIFRKNRL